MAGEAAVVVILLLLVELWLLSVAAEQFMPEAPGAGYTTLPGYHTPRMRLAGWWAQRKGCCGVKRQES